MPYWGYHKVREVLNRSPGEMSNEIPEIYEAVVASGLLDAFGTGDCIDMMVELVNDILALREAAGDVITPEIKMLTIGQVELHMTALVVKQYFEQQKAPLRFFVEPLMAEALSTTDVKGLHVSDLAEIPVQIHIYLPPMLVQAGQGYPEEALVLDKYESTDGRGKPADIFRIAVKSRSSDGKTYCYVLTDIQLTDEIPLADPPIKPHDRNEFTGVIDEEGLRAAVKILFNMLLYWKSVDPDILKQLNPQWEKAQRKVTRHKKGSKKRERAQNGLRAIPRNEHFVVGHQLEVIRKRKEMEVPSSSSEKAGPSNRRVAWHQTRGHWRWQACGEERKERKLIFIDAYWSGTLPPNEKVGYSVRS